MLHGAGNGLGRCLGAYLFIPSKYPSADSEDTYSQHVSRGP
jgi:hypothetical protein